MIGLIRKTDSQHQVEYFTIVGINESSLFDQMVELNDHAYHCETGNDFRLIAHRDNGQWFLNNGEMVSNEYISALMNQLK